MRLTRIHVAAPLVVGQEVTLPESAAAHLARVLRLQAGDPCVLFNGDGHDYAARITILSKREVRARGESARAGQRVAAAHHARSGRRAWREDGLDPAEGNG